MEAETDKQTKTYPEEVRELFDTSLGHYSDRSARWLFKMKSNVQGLVGLVANELVDHLDFSQLINLNRSFVSDTLRELESDMVFSVPFQSDSDTDDLLIYILIEHQSTVDPLMGFRVLWYMCQIWDMQQQELAEAKKPKSEWRLQPILPIVYYTGEQRWKTPLSLSAIMDVPEVLSRFVPRFDTLFLSVKETDAADLTKTDHLLGRLLTVLQQENADADPMLETLHATLAYLDALEPEDAAQHRHAILYLYQLVLFRRPEAEREQLVQLLQTRTHDEEVRNIIMTGAEALIQQGKD